MRATLLKRISPSSGIGPADDRSEAGVLIPACTARFASRLIGEREILHIHESHSQRAAEWQSSKTTSEHRVTESAVLPSEIEQLPDLAGYLKLASSPSCRRVNITRP